MRKAPRVVLFLRATRGFDRGMLAGITRYTMLHGPWTFYRQPHGYLRPESRVDVQELQAWKPDGMFCSVEQLDRFAIFRVPMIAYNVNEYHGYVPAILSGDPEAGTMAAEHLLRLGHRHFAFCGYANIRWSCERCKAFCAVIEAAGFRVAIYGPHGRAQADWAQEEPQVRHWLQSLPKPVGLLCANDDRAESVLEMCPVLGYSVPEDISIIGVDDDQYVCELQNPPLSSIGMASDRAGYEAAALLERMIRGEERMVGQRILAPATGVTVRQSTSVLMVRDSEVRNALRFIRENANWAVRVADVVRASPLSHRALNERFHAELGGSIKRQLTEARVAYISRLLLQTSTPIREIAVAAGYEDDRHFARYFKRATGMTPRAFRRKYVLP